MRILIVLVLLASLLGCGGSADLQLCVQDLEAKYGGNDYVAGQITAHFETETIEEARALIESQGLSVQQFRSDWERNPSATVSVPEGEEMYWACFLRTIDGIAAGSLILIMDPL